MEKISIKLPQNSLYLKAVRLFVAGLGSDLDFDIEQIEDLKVLVSEAINYKITEEDVQIDFLVEDNILSIEVRGKDKTADTKAISMRDAILKALADDLETGEDFLKISMRKTYD